MQDIRYRDDRVDTKLAAALDTKQMGVYGVIVRVYRKNLNVSHERLYYPVNTELEARQRLAELLEERENAQQKRKWIDIYFLPNPSRFDNYTGFNQYA